MLEFIKKLFGNNKINTQILIQDLSKDYESPNKLEIGLYTTRNEPLRNKNLVININNKNYNKETDDSGIAKLNINLPAGKYKATVLFKGDDEYNKSTGYAVVEVIKKIEKKPTRMEGIDIIMSEKDGTKYQCAVYDENNNRLQCNVNITVNGVKYIRTTDSDGLARLNLNLNSGKYSVIAEYTGDDSHNPSSTTNSITINPKIDKNFGYWVFGRDMKNVNLEELKNKKVNHIFLNYYAFEAHGENEVKQWINNANKNNINVHIWMQCFYKGDWINPATNDMSYKIEEAKKYANIEGVYGIHLDYLRYPGNAYKTSGGTEAINNFVREIKNNIPNKVLSCAVMPENDAEYYYGQDFSELGKYLNFIIPMQYKGNYSAGTSWLASTTRDFSSKATIWSGLQSYKSDDDTSLLSKEELKNDVRTCMSNGAKGVIIFRYGLSENIDFDGV